MSIRPVNTEGDYEFALERIETLWGAAPGTPEGNELDVLLTLVTVYEERNHPVPPPSPIEAIKFVMDERGLKQADLIPYIGSKSKVSEVLNGKRNLTLSMIRALHIGLSIPAEILIQEDGTFPEDGQDINWNQFPVNEIVSREWILGFDPKTQQEEIIRELATQAGKESLFTTQSCFRQGSRRNAKDDPFAIQAWVLKVLAESKQKKLNGKYNQKELDISFLRKIAHLSVTSKGPIVVQEYLLSKGIKLVTVPHLKKTYVDAVVLFDNQDTPVIGMSIRYDRTDNFWFTLMHELSHLCLNHLLTQDDCIIDDLDVNSALNEKEIEADTLAQEALIPNELWIKSKAKQTSKIEDVIKLSREADINPAIVAGRIRYEKNNYRLLAKHVGHKNVRKLFYS
ncbi:ImmA/IrrE family metallo-endopeptidase [Maridesulfovibrio sp.]|uniref:ImmA/IrrE family metallo-endopeptidase n=1 Tax=Maridesulfovibrio sp. TaxID=2795000 RepID=UPI002AA8A34F|nr:ImmA/IrrE family metallo-endopeptidase [Maridesulfovibrio sp.]